MVKIGKPITKMRYKATAKKAAKKDRIRKSKAAKRRKKK
jgi:hypothetical protein